MTSEHDRTAAFAVLTAYEIEETTPGAVLAARSLELARTYGPAHPGFVSCRVFEGEDRKSIVVLTEWTSREAFEAFRAGSEGREMVADAIVLHPKITFLLPAGIVSYA